MSPSHSKMTVTSPRLLREIWCLTSAVTWIFPSTKRTLIGLTIFALARPLAWVRGGAFFGFSFA